MNDTSETVYVVDDDPALREVIARVLSVEGYETQPFGSAAEFLEVAPRLDQACLLLDIRMPGLDGLGLQTHLHHLRLTFPVIFMTGHGQVSECARAMKDGAIDFLLKPFEPGALLVAVRSGLAKARLAAERRQAANAWREKLGRLTKREAEVLELVAAGKLNKEIAADLGTVEKTIKVHRGQVMRKLGVQSVAELVEQVIRGKSFCQTPAEREITGWPDFFADGGPVNGRAG